MYAFTVLVTLALSAFASAQAQGAAPAAGGEQAPCPPQFTLQCCQHVISAPDAGLFKLTIDSKTLPGLASTGCATLQPSAQCASYPVCCKSVTSAYSAGCIPA